MRSQLRILRDNLADWLIDQLPDPGPPTTPGRMRRFLSPIGWPIDKLSRTMVHLAGGAGPYAGGEALLKRGRYGAAADAFREAAEGFDREVGRDHVWTAQALANEGRCYLLLGRSADATVQLRDALRIAKKVLAPGDPLILEYTRLLDEAESL